VAMGGRMGAEWPLRRRMRLRTYVDTLVPALDSQLWLDAPAPAPDRVLWRSPPVTLTLSLGIAVEQ